MIHDYAKAFNLDPDIVAKKDIRKLLEYWAIENNKNAPSNYRMDNK